MGQRHQIYVILKSKKQYTCIGAFHHQWCYGATAATNLIRLVEAARKAKRATFTDGKWSKYALHDQREIDVLVKSIYGFSLSGTISMVHNENDCLIDENGNALPHLGDNNDGAGVIVIDDAKEEIRGGLFTPGHLESKSDAWKKWKIYSPIEYFNFYYPEEKGQAFSTSTDDLVKLQNEILHRPINLITQKEFNVVFKVSKGAK